MKSESKGVSSLAVIKAVHTAVWAFFAGCILSLPLAGYFKRFDVAFVLGGCVLFECAVLALNRGQCPFTSIAARLTSNRSPSFDIYLPTWLARRNKLIFGTLFVLNAVIVTLQWLVATERLPIRQQ